MGELGEEAGKKEVYEVKEVDKIEPNWTKLGRKWQTVGNVFAK